MWITVTTLRSSKRMKNRTLSSKLVFNEKADVYGFAVTCFEIVTRRTPFEGLLQGHTWRNAILDGSRPKLSQDLDLEVRAMIIACWDPNPSLRPSFDKLKATDTKNWEDI